MQISVFSAGVSFSTKKTDLVRLMRSILRKERKKIDELNIIITDNQHIREINKKFLHRNRTTNVISFDMGDVAEIYVSKDSARDRQELIYFIIHGLLHIIGYEHRNYRAEKLMERKCFEYLQHV